MIQTPNDCSKIAFTMRMPTAFTRSEKRIILLCSIFSFVLRVPLAFRPLAALTGFPYGDDSFYVFSVAKNLALGHGLSVDGTHLTNGIQPLIVFLYTPLFWLTAPDAWLAVRWTFVLNGVIAGLSVWAVARLIRSFEITSVSEGRTLPSGPTLRLLPLSAALMGAILWTTSSSIYAETTNGLETGLYSLLILLSLTMYVRLRRDDKPASIIPITRWLILGVMLGFTVLARIDAAVLVALIVFAEWWHGRVRGGLLMGATAVAISAPWWAYNLIYFGSLMPISGQSENSWFEPLSHNVVRLVQTLDDVMLVSFYTPNILSIFLRVASGCFIILFLYLLLRKTGLRNYIKQGAFLRLLWPFATFCVFLVIYYTFFFMAPHFILRYLQPLRILWIVLVALVTPFVFTVYRQFPSRRRLATRLALGVFILFSIGFAIDRYAYRLQDTSYEDFYKMGVWAQEHPSEKIAMFSSGIASFVAPNVINLDGKVNAAALRAHEQGRLPQYFREEHITYLADWKDVANDFAATMRKDGLFFDSTGRIEHIELMKRCGNDN